MLIIMLPCWLQAMRNALGTPDIDEEIFYEKDKLSPSSEACKLSNSLNKASAGVVCAFGHGF